MFKSLSNSLRVGRTVLLTGSVVICGGSTAFLTASVQPRQKQAIESKDNDDPVPKRTARDVLQIPQSVVANLGLKTAVVSEAIRPRTLPPLQGCLAIDTTRLARVHTRFAGDVVSIGGPTEPSGSSAVSLSQVPQPRRYRIGDSVKAGDLLVVISSKDLGEKKSEYLDAFSKLQLDLGTLRRLEAGFKDGSIPERSVREAARAAESDRVAVDRAERTLRTWRLTDTELTALRNEAERLADPAAKKAEASDWSRVEIRSPIDGVILEQNLAVGDIVDPAVDLFKIGDLSRLTVWAHLYEDDLPHVQSLPQPLTGQATIISRPGQKYAVRFDRIGSVVDATQHTVLISGSLDNSDGLLKAGQFVSICLELQAPKGVLEIPTNAMVEDGQESIVFVKTGDSYRRVVVRVERRFHDVVQIRADGAVNAGDSLVVHGAILLREALDQLPVTP